jgi:hypothetical protein
VTKRKHAALTAVGLACLFAGGNKTLEGAEAPSPAAKPAAVAAKKPITPQTGKVLEVLSASNYTYLRVDTGREKLWLAAPQTKIKTGDKITFGAGLPMKNFQSKSLGRTFDTVYFVDQIARDGDKAAAQRISQASGQTLPQGHPSIDTKNDAATKMDFSRITKASGGNTVAEIYAQKPQLAGKKTAVRGKVVKYNGGIMGKNWIHLKDGTGAEGSNDLTVTTKAEAKVGDTVLVRGNVIIDKDYGYGYKYPVIIEDAEVTVEK